MGFIQSNLSLSEQELCQLTFSVKMAKVDQTESQSDQKSISFPPKIFKVRPVVMAHVVDN